MRNSAREAALNIIFAQQFNNESDDSFLKKVYKQFALTNDEILFAADLVDTVNEHWDELIQGIEQACHHYLENRINPMDKTILLIDIWNNQQALDMHHASPMMQKIINLREKYDLNMKVERYVTDKSGIPEKDKVFIRD